MPTIFTYFLLSFRPSEFFRPPKRIPKFLLHDFTHGGKISVEEIYKDGTKGKTFSESYVEKLGDELKKNF